MKSPPKRNNASPPRRNNASNSPNMKSPPRINNASNSPNMKSPSKRNNSLLPKRNNASPNKNSVSTPNELSFGSPSIGENNSMSNLFGETGSINKLLQNIHKPRQNNIINSKIINNTIKSNSTVNNHNFIPQKVSNNSLNRFMNTKQKSINDQLSYLIEGMKKIEDTKLKIIEDLNAYKVKTTRKIIDLESVVNKFYNFIAQLNSILMDNDIDKVQYITELVNHMKSNKPFISSITKVLQENQQNNSRIETNSLNVVNSSSKKGTYTSNSVKSKLGSFTIKKALNSINKML